MVAKSEVRAYPVIGLLARRAGPVFVDRERLSTLPRMVAAVSGALAGGAAIGAFPKGTTWCGPANGRFRPAVFQAAVDTATPVRPVALSYRLAGAGTTTVASFVGSAALWESAVLVAGARGLVVEVRLLPLLPPRRSRPALPGSHRPGCCHSLRVLTAFWGQIALIYRLFSAVCSPARGHRGRG
ncbi:MAG TPA: 1-acyl-sn-glycerol-3-phosphate acyltransferase [Pseudonocardiaceae bacterium]|jgi:hypothetical protein|nr:1-acyl-sn-glycerol-3-phosphate acyltransferase [Pseudonocardiaceae bacterium]